MLFFVCAFAFMTFPIAFATFFGAISISAAHVNPETEAELIRLWSKLDGHTDNKCKVWCCLHFWDWNRERYVIVAVKQQTKWKGRGIRKYMMLFMFISPKCMQ